jgi:hypothetical protein
MARETAQQTRPDPSCVVPREPLVALVNSPSAGDLIAVETVETASLALYWVGVFNQLVQQQTDFNARHLAEIRDARIEEERLAAIGRGAYEISHMVHATGIASANAEGGWYRRLSEAVETNIADLEKRLRSWRQYTWVGLTVGLLLGTLVLAGWRSLTTPVRLRAPCARILAVC